MCCKTSYDSSESAARLCQLQTVNGSSDSNREWMRLSGRLALVTGLLPDWDVPLRSGLLAKAQSLLRQTKTTQTERHSRKNSVTWGMKRFSFEPTPRRVCGARTFRHTADSL